MLILWLVACGGDPELRAQRNAITAWREGKAALESGDAEGALERFESARTHQPDDPVVAAWVASAHAKNGDLEGAVEGLGGVLESSPHFAEARYNRAAYLARLGRLDEAGAELSWALDDGAARARQAMVDPDFAPHLEHPAFAFLPDEMLLVALDAPSEALFWGSEATVRFRIVGGLGAPATLDAEQLQGPIELISAAEDVVESSEGLVRDLSWTYKVRGAGEVLLGPFTVHSDPWTAEVRAVAFPATAPPGKSVPQGLPALSFDTPTTVAAGLQPPAVRYINGVLDVMTAPGDRVRIDPPPTAAPVIFELNDRSKPVWKLARYRVDKRPRVRVMRGAEQVLVDPE